MNDPVRIITEFFTDPLGIASIVFLILPFLPKLVGVISERKQEPQPKSSRTLFQFYLSLISAVLLSYLAVRFFYRPGQWAALRSAGIFIIGTLAGTILFYTLANTEPDKDIADAFRISFIEPLHRFRRKAVDLRRDHRRVAVSLLIVGAILLVAGLYFVSRPRPSNFLVYISRNTNDEVGGGTADSFLTNIMNEGSELEELGIHLSDDPLDFQAADLRITLGMSNTDCKSDSAELVSWGWDATNRRRLNSSLLRYVRESGVVGSDDARALCIGGDNAMAVIAFITFANGLNALLADPPDTEAAIESFRYITDDLKDMRDTTADGEQAEGIPVRVLNFPKRIKTCAALMSIVADGFSASDNSENDVERLKAVIANGPVTPEKIGHINWDTFDLSDELLDLEYCHAQAYYWLGRAALTRHQIDLFDDQSNADVITVYAYQDEALPEPHSLDQAIDYFTLALEISPIEIETTGYWWSYYFYRALARYRQGDFEQALDDLEAARRSFEEHPLNGLGVDHIGEPTINYLHARIELERAAYQQRLFPTACLGAMLPSDTDTLLADMRNMVGEGEYGLAPLSVGTMALFDEALFRVHRDPTDAEGVIDLLSRARQQVAGDAGSAPENYSHIDVLRDKLYKFDGNGADNAPVASEKTVEDFLVGMGAPAYVIPVYPYLLPDHFCGNTDDNQRVLAHQPHRGDFRFVWLLRNRFDELLFDYRPFPPQYKASEGDTGLEECDATFCVALDNGAGERRYWRLNDRGFGLFTSDPVNPIHAALTAEPGPGKIIYFRGAPTVSLVYTVEGHEPKEILLGELPVEFPARLEPQEATGTIHMDVSDCESCYNVDVVISLDSDAPETSPVSLEGLEDLKFSATLYERVIDGGADPAEGQWWIIGSDVELIIDESGRISGTFHSARLNPNGAHALQVLLKDRAGVVLAEDWIKSLDIRVPE